jgi:hypothetical protein
VNFRVTWPRSRPRSARVSLDQVRLAPVVAAALNRNACMLDFRQSTLRKRTQRHHPKMPPRSPLVPWLFRSTLALFATLSVLAGVQARAEPGGSLTFIEVRVEALADIAMQQVAVAARQSVATWALWPGNRPSGPITLTSSAGGTASRNFTRSRPRARGARVPADGGTDVRVPLRRTLVSMR